MEDLDDGEETLRERQENELQALQAIFMDEISDLRKGKKWKPPELRLKLQPQQSMGMGSAYVSVDLHIWCGPDYPEKTPKIRVENGKGLSDVQMEILEDQLQKLANKLQGEVMILELALAVQTFLRDHNKPPRGSFYEEMLAEQRKKKEEELKREEELEKEMLLQEEMQRQAMLEEIAKKQEANKAELRKERKRRTEIHVEHGASPSPNRERRLSCRRRLMSTASEPCDDTAATVTKDKNESITFYLNNEKERIIHKMEYLRRGTRGSAVYWGVDRKSDDLLALTEWKFKVNNNDKHVSNNKDKNSYMKQLVALEGELSWLRKLQHKNIVLYNGFHYTSHARTITVHILTELVVGVSLSWHLVQCIPANSAAIRHYALGVLEALAYLHQRDVVHRDLTDSSVFMEDASGIIRVSDHSLTKKLYDLKGSISSESVKASDEDAYPPPMGRSSKKADIHRFGIVMLSLLMAEIERSPTPSIPKSLSKDLQEFLARCLEKDERSRWTADQLLDHSFLKKSMNYPMSSRTDRSQVASDSRSRMDEELPFSSFFLGSAEQSRLYSEFQIIKLLGKGGFGDVMKARNKLDGGLYAIKRILLNPENKQLNRKITREVKLLSRLNHENVVRYYYSWIETMVIQNKNKSSDSSGVGSVKESTRDSPTKDSKTSKAVECNFYQDSSSSEDEEDDDDDDDDESWFAPPNLDEIEESDGGIVFVDSKGNAQSTEDESKPLALSENKPVEQQPKKLIKYMYIQMEFCENQTLRTAIDAGLYSDRGRVWRLFREILEGLAHIHQQGMIHRDLKPVNIFLDSRDHVKIGDFGLATSDSVNRSFVDNSLPDYLALGSKSDTTGDNFLTGKVGTTLYIAPELGSGSSHRTTYTQKVDIYSLGVMFFEMCWQPLKTGMERVKILGNLRHSSITLPTDAEKQLEEKQISVIRWLLEHEPKNRPTSEELLQSDILPPPQFEEAELHDIVQHTLSCPQSKAYKFLINSCFSQEWEEANNYMFDEALSRNISTARYPAIQTMVRRNLAKVFERHAAVEVQTPLLMPPPNIESSSPVVDVLIRSGGVVSLPWDLHVCFARWVAHNDTNSRKSHVCSLRRYYGFSKVFRERRPLGYHPREMLEGCFDIVSPTSAGTQVDAEVLSVIWECIAEFPSLLSRGYYLRVSHSSLLPAIFSYCGIEDSQHGLVLTALGENKLTRAKEHLMVSLSKQTVQKLIPLLECEGPHPRVLSRLRPVLQSRGTTAYAAKQAMAELKQLTVQAQALGVKCEILIAPTLVYNIKVYSGTMFQLVSKKQGGQDVIAVGGRYDSVLTQFRRKLKKHTTSSHGIGMVGASIWLERLVAALCKDGLPEQKVADVLLTSLGSVRGGEARASLAKELWTAGIATHIHFESVQSIEELNELAKDLGANHVAVLRESGQTLMLVRSYDRDREKDSCRYTEKKLYPNELVEYLKSYSSDIGDSDSSTSTSSAVMTRSTSISSPPSFMFLTNEKLPLHERKRHQTQIGGSLSSILALLHPRCSVEVLVTDLPAAVLHSLSSCLDWDSAQAFSSSINSVSERHPRYRKYLLRVCEKMQDVHFSKTMSVIILYSLPDSCHEVFIK